MLCIKHLYGTIWLNAVQALIYGPMLCIRHHNNGSNLHVHHVSILLVAVASMTQGVHHESINMAQCSMIHHTKLTTSYFSTPFFATLFAVNT